MLGSWPDIYYKLNPKVKHPETYLTGSCSHELFFEVPALHLDENAGQKKSAWN